MEEKAPLNAQRWLEGLWDAVDTLETWPTRCSLAPENAYRPFEIRKLNHGSHLILFTINKEQATVYVIGLRHGMQEPASRGAPCYIHRYSTRVTGQECKNFDCNTDNHCTKCLSMTRPSVKERQMTTIDAIAITKIHITQDVFCKCYVPRNVCLYSIGNAYAYA
ncbi:type II toxin-antitoxin system RelE/ParE family toxin [Phycisphaerales bacterium AB-hyl4]|uniref:Type II toxin-antitoxin system RelE/ParE family toxin n=1 Tax=Natronomicrosphaera hydrolytica TaxID=3242702 RepID=A0ABV4U8D5_9BACT